MNGKRWLWAFSFFGVLSLILVNFVWPQWNHGGVLSVISIVAMAFSGIMVVVSFGKEDV